MSSKPKNISEALSELDRQTGSKPGEFSEQVIKEFQGLSEAFEQLRPKIDELSGRAKDELGKAKDSVEKHARENPWAVIGAAGLILFIIGFLLGSRRR